jgi:hypothetical protein
LCSHYLRLSPDSTPCTDIQQAYCVVDQSERQQYTQKSLGQVPLMGLCITLLRQGHVLIRALAGFTDHLRFSVRFYSCALRQEAYHNWLFQGRLVSQLMPLLCLEQSFTNPTLENMRKKNNKHEKKEGEEIEGKEIQVLLNCPLQGPWSGQRFVRATDSHFFHCVHFVPMYTTSTIHTSSDDGSKKAAI